MFTSSDWLDSKWAKEHKGKTIANIVLMPSFWNTIVFFLKISDSLVCVLRLVDGEKKNPMGYIYEAMNRAKDTIVRSFNGNEEKYKETSTSLIRGGRFSFIGLCMQQGTF